MLFAAYRAAAVGGLRHSPHVGTPVGASRPRDEVWQMVEIDRDETLRRLQQLREQVEALESSLAAAEPGASTEWPPEGYYLAYHVMVGIMLGFIGALSSLVFNVVGSVLVGQHPLQLIRVYLTFPLGESALTIEQGMALAIGCCLYLATGGLFGILFHVVLSRFYPDASRGTRIAVVTVLGVLLWLFNFYAVLSWLQPLLFGGSWIVDMVPFWVAAVTHLVFAWTMLLVDEWGTFDARAHVRLAEGDTEAAAAA